MFLRRRLSVIDACRTAGCRTYRRRRKRRLNALCVSYLGMKKKLQYVKHPYMFGEQIPKMKKQHLEKTLPFCDARRNNHAPVFPSSRVYTHTHHRLVVEQIKLLQYQACLRKIEKLAKFIVLTKRVHPLPGWWCRRCRCHTGRARPPASTRPEPPGPPQPRRRCSRRIPQGASQSRTARSPVMVSAVRDAMGESSNVRPKWVRALFAVVAPAQSHWYIAWFCTARPVIRPTCTSEYSTQQLT